MNFNKRKIMANKRQLKKAIHYACGNIAGECFFAECMTDNTEPGQWDEIIVDTALLQEEAVKRVSAGFDKKPSDFPNRQEYNKARRAHFKAAEKALAEHMRTETEGLVSRMNALLPKGKE